MRFLVTFMDTQLPVVLSSMKHAETSWAMTYSNMPGTISILPRIHNEIWEVFYRTEHGTEKVGEIVRVLACDTPIHF